MAGGPSTPELAIAVCEAGALGFLAAGYKRADAVSDEIQAVRESTNAPFGVNLFVPAPAPADPDRLRDYLRRLGPEAERQGAELGEPRFDDDDWAAKLEVLYEEPAGGGVVHVRLPGRICGEPPPRGGGRRMGHGHERARGAGGARGRRGRARRAGHRGRWAPRRVRRGRLGRGRDRAARVAPDVAGATSLPLIATGGIADGAALAAVLCAGASAGQIGTALMLAPEAGTADAQRKALAERRPTRVTRAFTGRAARGIVNRFMTEHSDAAPVAYPEIHHVTSPLRAAARRAGDADAFNLWAGQAHELVQARPAGEIVREMAAEARAVLERVSAGLRDPDTSSGRC